MTGKRGAMPQETMIVALSAIGPVIGSGIGVFKRPTTAYIRNLLYFAAGIMLAISFLDLIPESIHLGGRLTCVTGLSLGAATMALLDRQFPHVHDCAACGEEACQLGHTANFLILAIFLHNFPEGMAIAVGAATDVGDSLVIAMAIAIHNIPEGICTSAPHYFIGNRTRHGTVFIPGHYRQGIAGPLSAASATVHGSRPAVYRLSCRGLSHVGGRRPGIPP
jgi:ZIP family zinc transporter